MTIIKSLISVLTVLTVSLLSVACGSAADAPEPEPLTAQIVVCESPCLASCLASGDQHGNDCYEVCARHREEDVCHVEVVELPAVGQ